MKKTFLTITALSMLIFTGCNQKTPTPSGNNITDYGHIEGDTIVLNEDAMMEGMGEGGYIDENGQSLLNSSKDGFKSTYFGFDKYTISPSMYEIMEENIQVAKSTTSRIKIEGNCDSFGTDEYNYALGLKRAKSIKEKMVSAGVEKDRLVIVSMGESNPACDTLNEGCYKSNRRGDIYLVR